MRSYFCEGELLKTEKNAAAMRDVKSLDRAMEEGEILEAVVLSCDSDHTLFVDLGGVPGIIRAGEALALYEGERVKDIAIISRVNRAVCFKIIGRVYTDGVLTYELSRRAAQQECMDNYLSRLEPGEIIDAVITYNENFGSFADIGCGVSALMHIDTVSVSRISHPNDRFFVGQRIRAAVKSRDEKGRICLTHRELLGTWEQNAALFKAGQTVTGVVRSVEEYGVFVELTPNLAGLAEGRAGVCAGQTAVVFIKSINPEKMKIKLIIIDAAFEQKQLPEKYDYFFTGDSISEWHYSPFDCQKQISTYFIRDID